MGELDNNAFFDAISKQIDGELKSFEEHSLRPIPADPAAIIITAPTSFVGKHELKVEMIKSRQHRPSIATSDRSFSAKFFQWWKHTLTKPTNWTGPR